MKNITALLEVLKKMMTGRMLIIIGSIIALLVAFQLGVVVGIHKASFSFGMGDNYYRAFGGDRDMRGPLGGELPSAHGAAGQIVSVTLPTFTVDDHGTEKIVLVTDDTKIRHLRDEGTTSNIIIGDFAVVLGEPNDSAQIEARLIRILPPPKTATSTPQQ